MNFLGNIIWFLLGGFLTSMMYIIGGLLMCVTIIGIPFDFADNKPWRSGSLAIREGG